LQERGVDAALYAQSTIVKTSAPTELGTLRKADGEEGFAAEK
jgi:GDP-D-mannose 3',5'-epimerase